MIKKKDFLVRLNSMEKEEFKDIALKLNFQKNNIIFANGDQPDYVYLIESGLVKIYRLNSDGDAITVAIRHSGELFGLAEAVLDEPRKCFAQALDNTSLLAVKSNDWKTILKSMPELSLKVNRMLALRLRRAEEIIYDLITYNVSGRLASLLLHLQDQCGCQTSDGIVLNIKLTHSEIAAIIGSTRQSVTQILNEFKDEGAIKINDKKIIVTNKNKLQSKIY